MFAIGLDLAWGQRNPSGIAVLDEHGTLVHLSAARGDDEIVEELAPFVQGDCLLAVDAPLIVRNESGTRPAEAALNRDFARFDAGTHPVNTARPEFQDSPRGARIAARLQVPLDGSPDLPPFPGVPAPGGRRAIEVYPHAASVALFRLGRTLKYKHKPGRDLATVRGQLLELIRLIETLQQAEPGIGLGQRWQQLRAAVQQAATKSAVRQAEDQVDAVLCAYVARFAAVCPQRTAVYGEAEHGRIVTPRLPDGHVPIPRSATAALESAGLPESARAVPDVREAIRRYAAAQDDLAVAGQQFIRLVRAILDDAGINYLSVTGRIKTVESFAAKAVRTVDGAAEFPDPLSGITDQIGVRVITYVRGDVDVVADLLGEQVIVKDDRDLGRETASEGRFGYASRHLLIAVDPARHDGGEFGALQGRVAAVQVRTVLQHAWAEFEHDIRYKGTVPREHAPEFDRRFTLAAGLLELADQEFSAIRARLRPQNERAERGDDDPRLDPRELAAFLAGQYADAGWSRTDHYAWISGLLLELGITSLDELADVLRGLDASDLNARMDYRYPPGAVRRLDDALLAAFGPRYLRLHGNAHRLPALQARLEKLRPGQEGRDISG